MKTIVTLIVSLLFAIPPAWSQDQIPGENDIFLYEFLDGSYDLIGKVPDSEQTYSGRVDLKYTDGQLRVVRVINGSRVLGSGKIETVLADEIKVLRVHFRQDKKNYEVTYLIHADLDNYGRLSGHLYLEDGSTKKPGLETLFVDRRAVR